MTNENMTMDESTLIAYVDGELDSETAREVEERLATDKASHSFVERHRAISALARIAFNDTMHEEVPEHLKNTINASSHLEKHSDSNVAGSNVIALKKHAGSSKGAFPMAMAAAIAGLLIGAGGGYEISGQQTEQKLKLAAMTIQQDEAAMKNTLNQALEVNLSGTPTAWSNPNSGQSVSFTPVRTYQDKSGGFCREYRKDSIISGEATSTFGLACRSDKGKWQTRYLIFENGDLSL